MSLVIQNSEFLRYLRLECVELSRYFDWTKLKNLTELHSKEVTGINAQTFIEFVRHRPNLRVFRLELGAFDEDNQTDIPDIAEVMAEYFGDQIEEYSTVQPQLILHSEPQPRVHEFISRLKIVKRVGLKTVRLCIGDLIDAFRRLAENDTVEVLDINYSINNMILPGECIFKDTSNLLRADMKHFSHLKTINIFGENHSQRLYTCEPFVLLRVYGSKILSNIENLTIDSKAGVWDFIKFARNLRYLGLSMKNHMDSKQAIEILSALDIILQMRNDGRTKNDYIEIKCKFLSVFNIFAEIDGRSDAIKLSIA